MKKETRQDSFIRQPFYQGGDKALIEFVMKNLKYPDASLPNKVEGDVHIRYDIDIKGNVTELKIISGLDNHCNEEATCGQTVEVCSTPKPSKAADHFSQENKDSF
jgi:Gram-negative bacterial TonB protein C-terminal